MGGNPETGAFRELSSENDLKEGEILFKTGEILNVKGMDFVVQNIHPNPENTLILKGTPKK